MTTSNEFDDIRSYNDEEVQEVIDRLLQDSEFQQIISFIFPEQKKEDMAAWLRSFQSKHDFQHQLIKLLVCRITDKCVDSLECTGFENIRQNESYTFISNHRDIVMDAALLCLLLSREGYETTEIAIGDNLLIRSWIKDLVRLNKSFIVKRGVGIRQMLEVSQHLSRYIHYTITQKKESIWIARREGRAKDSNDRTQESVLKMLTMSGGADYRRTILDLNIVPLSLSYEYDPCDFLKAKELQQRRDNPDFKKSPADDLENMQTGIFGYKGRIHFQFGQPIHSDLEKIAAEIPKTEWFSKVASLIDREIFRNYLFFPINYIAYDRLEGGNRFSDRYTSEDAARINSYFDKQLGKIDLPNKDIPFLTEKILEMYANPVRNQLNS